jgi:O-acetyl-ADP-ribose deacetylase (regulator of RNase III)
MEGKIGILQGDITKLAVDLMVNPVGDVTAAFYRENLDRAVADNFKTIAFPAIGCERIALQSVGDFLRTDDGAKIDGVSFVCVSDETYDAFVEAFGALVYV